MTYRCPLGKTLFFSSKTKCLSNLSSHIRQICTQATLFHKKSLDKNLLDGIQENRCQLFPDRNTERRSGLSKNDTVLRAILKQTLNSLLQYTYVTSSFISSYCPFLEKSVEAFLLKTKWEVESFIYFFYVSNIKKTQHFDVMLSILADN